MSKKSAAAQTSFLSYELLDAEIVLKVIDNLNEILPVEQQVYTINGHKTIDQKRVLMDMFSSIRKGELAVNYIYSQYSLNHGRQYAFRGRSVQSLSRVLRHTLCAETYRDFDIVNCHPTIALHYCKNMCGWDVPYLQNYVDNRDEVIQELLQNNPNMTRDDVKKVFLAILNGGSADYKKVVKKTEVLMGMYHEIKEVFGKMLELEENKELLAEVEKSKKGKTKNMEEIRRSVCNKVFIDIENEILVVCIEWLKSEGYDIRNIVLMFDGFMLPRMIADKLPETWATILSDYVANHTKSGIRVKFVEKVMDEGKNIHQFQLKSVYQEKIGDVVEDAELRHYVYNQTDGEMCNIICKVFHDKFVADGDKLYYFNNHRWRDNGSEVFIRETRKIAALFDNIVTEAKTIYEMMVEDTNAKEDYTLSKRARDSFNSLSSLKRAKEFLVSEVYRDDFKGLLDSVPGIIGFENGVFDLRGDRPVFRDGVPEDYVSLTTGYNYIEPENCLIAEAFLRDVVSEKTYPSFLQFLGSLIYGGNKEHKATFFVGSGSNGKSLVCEVLGKVFGHYLRNIAKEIYTKEKKHAGGAEPHLMELKGRLVGLTNETEEADKFIAGTFKSLSSSDEITTRGMFEKRQTTFTPLYKPIINTNYKPQFTSFDDGVARRIRLFDFPYKFVDASLAVNEPDEDGNITIIKKVKDLDLGNKLKRPEVVCQFVKLMVDNLNKGAVHESEEMQESVKTYMAELNPLTAWFKSRLEHTNNPRDVIKSQDLLSDFNTHTSSNMTSRKFCMLLASFAALQRAKTGMVLRGWVFKEVSDTEEDF